MTLVRGRLGGDEAEAETLVHRRIRLIHVIAGLDRAIHHTAHDCCGRWMPGSSPGMTDR
jgi:hypothetical protein